MADKGIRDLYIDELKDLYNAENQLVKANQFSPSCLEWLPQERRTTSLQSSKISRAGRLGLATLCSIVQIAISPISRHGWRRVVSGVPSNPEYFTSSIPTIRTCLGTLTPSVSSVCIS